MLSTRRESSGPTARGGSFRRSLFITALLMCAVPVAAQELDEEIRYNARDSIRYDLQQQIVFLFGGARVVYGDIELTADRIEYRFRQEEARAFGAPDSTGAVAGKPVFIESDHRIEADSIRYNFRSKKGLIKEVRTSEQESYVQARVSKRHANGEVHSKGGTFTTCDRPHPHYYFRASRMMVIPDDKIVSGAAVMKIGPVPTPLVLPFGFFPNKKNGSAGILFPAYGDGGPLGYFLQNGGYYMPLGERADMQLTGDIYTRGSWALKALARYKVRYRFGGSLNLSFNNRRNSIPELPDFQRTRDFFVTWTHAVDSRASLTDRFNASVNVGTSTNFQNNFNSSTLNYLSNTFNSNIGWNHLWPGKPYSLAVNLRHSQNSATKNYDFTLPALTFNLSRIFPFQPKLARGRWYEQIGITYTTNFDNVLSTTEDQLSFDNLAPLSRRMRNGVKHSTTLSTSFKNKFFTLNPELAATERWYFRTLRQTYDSGGEVVVQDTIPTFRRNGDWRAGLQLTSKLYGMYQFRGQRLKAIRHVITPIANLGYRPDFDPRLDVYAPSDSIVSTYNPFDGFIYGASPVGESGTLSLAINQSLEAKVKNSKAGKDSTSATPQDPFRKMKLLDFVGLNTSYDLLRDSLRWSPVNLTARTTLFNLVNVNFGSVWDPYAVDTLGRRIDRSERGQTGRFARLTTLFATAGVELKSRKYGQAPEQQPPTVVGEADPSKGAKINFSLPWRLGINMNYDLSRAYLNGGEQDTERKSVTFNGDVTVFKYWKLGVMSGYDFEAQDWTNTSLNLYWDLHCWEFNFNIIPLGLRKSFSFQINVKASILRDLKYQQTRPLGNDGQLLF